MATCKGGGWLMRGLEGMEEREDKIEGGEVSKW